MKPLHTHVCHMGVHSKRKVPTAKIIITRHLPTPRTAKLERASSAMFRASVPHRGGPAVALEHPQL